MSRSDTELNKPPPDNLPLASILDSIGEAVQIIDTEWNFFYVNQAAADLGGRVAPELRGKNVWAEFPELLGSPLEDACRCAMREQVRIDFEFYYATGAIWFDFHLHPSPNTSPSMPPKSRDANRRKAVSHNWPKSNPSTHACICG